MRRAAIIFHVPNRQLDSGRRGGAAEKSVIDVNIAVLRKRSEFSDHMIGKLGTQTCRAAAPDIAQSTTFAMPGRNVESVTRGPWAARPGPLEVMSHIDAPNLCRGSTGVVKIDLARSIIAARAIGQPVARDGDVH